MQKAAEGTSLGHAKIPLQNKSLFLSLTPNFLVPGLVFSLQSNCLSLPMQILRQALNYAWVRVWISPGDVSPLAQGG